MTLLKDKEKRGRIRELLYDKLEIDGVEPATAVKQLRKMLAKDQESFSKFLGISLSTLRKIEQSRGNVTIQTLRKIFDRFSLKIVVKTR